MGKLIVKNSLFYPFIVNYYFLGKKISFSEVFETEKRIKPVRANLNEDYRNFECTSKGFEKLDLSLITFLYLFRIKASYSPSLPSVNRLISTCLKSHQVFEPEGWSLKGVVELGKPKKGQRQDDLYFFLNPSPPQFVVFHLDSFSPSPKNSDPWKEIVEVGRRHGARELDKGLTLTCPTECFTEQYIIDLVLATQKNVASVFWNAGSMGAPDKRFLDTILSSNFDADHYALEVGGTFSCALLIKEFQKIMDETSRCFYSFCPIVLKETKKKSDTIPAMDFGVTFTRDEYQYAAISTVPLHQDSSIPLERARKLIDELGIDIKTPVKKEDVLRENTEDF